MTDCPNAEVRDQLPELANGRLTPAARIAVETHVAQCLDCQAELALLERLRGALTTATPKVNVAQIVASLPKPRPAVRRQPRQTFFQAEWRVAAGFLVVALGGGAIWMANARNTTVPSADTVVADASRGMVTTADRAPELGMTGQLEDLTPAQLQVLIDRVKTLDAMPSSDADSPVMNGVIEERDTVGTGRQQ